MFKALKALKRVLRNSDATAEGLGQAVAGIANQTDLLNRKLEELISGSSNQTDLLNRKLEELISGSNNQTDLLNRKLEELISGSSNQTDLLNRKLEALILGMANQTDLLNRKHDRLVEAIEPGRLRRPAENGSAEPEIVGEKPTTPEGGTLKRPDQQRTSTERTGTPLVSILFLTYKQERFVLEAVRGLLQQTYSPLESSSSTTRRPMPPRKSLPASSPSIRTAPTSASFATNRISVTGQYAQGRRACAERIHSAVERR